MNTLRTAVALTLIGVCWAAGCSSSSSSGKGADGGTGGASGTFGNPMMCTGAGSGATNTCTATETTTYGNCVQAACNTTYTTCLGAGYKTGTYGGACGTWFKCASACPCTDTTCLLACGPPSADCTTCLQQFSTCSATCTEPACYSTASGSGGASGAHTGGASGTSTGGAPGTSTGGVSGSATGGTSGTATGTCADLTNCCNKAADATTKLDCTSTTAAVQSLVNAGMLTQAQADASCAQLLTSAMAVYCP